MDGLSNLGGVLRTVIFLGNQRTHTFEVLILSDNLSQVVFEFDSIMCLMQRILMKEALAADLLITLEAIEIVHEVMRHAY